MDLAQTNFSVKRDLRIKFCLFPHRDAADAASLMEKGILHSLNCKGGFGKMESPFTCELFLDSPSFPFFFFFVLVPIPQCPN